MAAIWRERNKFCYTWKEGKRDVREEIITRGSLAEDETQARQPNFVTRGSKLAGDGMNSTECHVASIRWSKFSLGGN